MYLKALRTVTANRKDWMMLASVTNGKQSRKLSAFIASSTVKGLE